MKGGYGGMGWDGMDKGMHKVSASGMNQKCPELETP